MRALVAQLVPVGAAASDVAGLALGDTHLRFAWPAWHPLTSTFTLRGRRGTDGDIHIRFAWEAFAVPHVGYVGYMLSSFLLFDSWVLCDALSFLFAVPHVGYVGYMLSSFLVV